MRSVQVTTRAPGSVGEEDIQICLQHAAPPKLPGGATVAASEECHAYLAQVISTQHHSLYLNERLNLSSIALVDLAQVVKLCEVPAQKLPCHSGGAHHRLLPLQQNVDSVKLLTFPLLGGQSHLSSLMRRQRQDKRAAVGAQSSQQALQPGSVQRGDVCAEPPAALTKPAAGPDGGRTALIPRFDVRHEGIQAVAPFALHDAFTQCQLFSYRDATVITVEQPEQPAPSKLAALDIGNSPDAMPQLCANAAEASPATPAPAERTCEQDRKPQPDSPASPLHAAAEMDAACQRFCQQQEAPPLRQPGRGRSDSTQ